MQPGGIIHQEGPIHVSNDVILNKDKTGVRVDIKFRKTVIK